MSQRPQNIILATRNAGKIRELALALAKHNLDVMGLESFPALEDVEETGSTFEENALLKARYVAKNTGLVAIADDSGLEVDALGGAPGIYSARYGNDLALEAGETKDMRNNRKLLQELATVAPAQRQARFVCCMVACTPEGKYIVAQGTWEGLILENLRGQQGFGYDPLFFDPQIQRCAAELTKEEKNARSHRGKALENLLAQWPQFYPMG